MPNRKVRTYLFGCPVCHKLFKADEPGEPCCTGPSEMRDDHELTVMHLVRVDDVDVHPEKAKKRADGPLLLPELVAEMTELNRGKLVVPEFY